MSNKFNRYTPKDMAVGSVFTTPNNGSFEIVEYRSAKLVKIRFHKTGREYVYRSDVIRKGTAKDLFYPRYYGKGYIGYGSHKDNPTASRAWRNMISRCYNKKDKRYGSYGGNNVTVCDEWLNFGVFTEWFNENYIDGYQMDKDKFSDHKCKIYSPSTCCFISSDENIEISQSRNFSIRSPTGLIVTGNNVCKFCRDNNLDQSAITRVLSGDRRHHKGWEAVDATKTQAIHPSIDGRFKLEIK